MCEQLGIVMMVEAFDCWHTGKLPYDYHLYFDQWGDSDIKEMVNAAKNSPAVVLVVDRQRDPGHRIVPWPGDRQAAGRRRQVDRHQPSRGDGLRPVPQRARHRVAAGPDRGRAGRPGRQLQHGHVHGRAAREVPGQVLLLLRDGLGDLHPRGVPGPAAAQHGGELHPGEAGHLLLRQQPGVLDDERGVRAEEGPGPQVLERGVPVVRAGLHRRADPVRRVPGQGVVLRRDGHGRVRQGRLLPVREPVDHRADGAHRADGLDQLRARAARLGLGVRERGHGRAFPQRNLAGGQVLRPEGDDLRAEIPGDHRAHPRRLQLPVGQLHQPQRQHGQAAPDLDGALRAGHPRPPSRRPAAGSWPGTRSVPPGRRTR